MGQRVDDRAGGGLPPMPPVVQDAMLRHPKTLPGTTTLGEVRAMLADDHVHVALLVDGQRLLGTIERSDLPTDVTDPAPALPFATLTGRTTGPSDDLESQRRALLAQRARRLAVVDQSGDLLGLLCLNRRGDGFCSDANVLERCRDANPEPAPRDHLSQPGRVATPVRYDTTPTEDGEGLR